MIPLNLKMDRHKTIRKSLFLWIQQRIHRIRKVQIDF